MGWAKPVNHIIKKPLCFVIKIQVALMFSASSVMFCINTEGGIYILMLGGILLLVS